MVEESFEPEIEYLHNGRNELRTLVRTISQAYFRLIWIAGGKTQQRSAVLKQISEEERFSFVDVGRKLSARLLDVNPSLRAHASEESFHDIIAASDADGFCLDHLDILFDQSLKLNAVDLVRNTSRKFVLVASWPGSVFDDTLIYGVEGHSSHIRIPFKSLECPVHLLPDS